MLKLRFDRPPTEAPEPQSGAVTSLATLAFYACAGNAIANATAPVNIETNNARWVFTLGLPDLSIYIMGPAKGRSSWRVGLTIWGRLLRPS